MAYILMTILKKFVNICQNQGHWRDFANVYLLNLFFCNKKKFDNILFVNFLSFIWNKTFILNLNIKSKR